MADPTKIPIDFDPQKQRMSGRTYHGGVAFDVPFISLIGDNLWQGGCRAGLILPTHVNYLISLYPWERYEIKHKTRGEMYIRMYDDPTQGLDQIDDLAKQVNEWRKKGQVLVHCQAGLNRSSLVVVKALMLSGMHPQNAIDLVRFKRSKACLSNKAFEEWLLNG